MSQLSKRDEIITSESAERLLGYILPIYNEDPYMLEVFQTIGEEIDELVKWVKDMENQPFPQFATFTLPFWEESIGLPVDEKLSIQQRRNRIVTRLSTYYPITRKRLESIASAAVNAPIKIEDFTGPYTFRVVIEDFDKVDFILLHDEVDEIKPAHLSFTMAPKINSSIVISSKITTDVREYHRVNELRVGMTLIKSRKEVVL